MWHHILTSNAELTLKLKPEISAIFSRKFPKCCPYLFSHTFDFSSRYKGFAYSCSDLERSTQCMFCALLSCIFLCITSHSIFMSAALLS